MEDLTYIGALPGANQDNWFWSSDKHGFVYVGGTASESLISAGTELDVTECASSKVSKSLWALGKIKQYAKSSGVKTSKKAIAKDAELVGKVAGAAAKTLAVASAVERYQKCRGD